MVFSRLPDSRTGPVLEVGVTIAGVLLMVGAGIAASPYTPSWFDPDDGPARSAGGVLTAMWVLEAVGLAMVLAGLVLTGRELRRMPAPPVTRPLPAWAVVVACAIAGAALCAVVGWFVLVGVLLSAPAIPAGLCLFWLVHAAAVTALDRRVAAAHASAFPSWLAGLVVGAAGVAAVVWWAVEMRGMLWALPVVDGAALALGLLAWRAAAGGIRPSQAGIGALGVLAAAATVIVATSGADQVGADQVGGVDSPAAPVLPPRAAVPAAPSAVPQPSPTPAPVDASVACAPEDLTWSANGWDAAMGTRAVSVVATSHAVRPCYVDGFPGITLAQGGRDLRLTTEPGSPSGPEVPEARRVGLAPGGTASFPLIWKGYGAAADEDTPQELRVTLAGGEPSTVALGTSPAPFDLVDGGTIRVGPWQPGP
ncbi:uncharacterized protein DUF4232 [Pseudonocardia hierapolitana]|uniref:Uncharacterized protein DUF4232 n=1 Tax=Pseudonocardia hierapolitana TaxID=1128676 RepID=A0A561SYH2_9PSEU|nr:DUF4232 domain-containing protein [Pseudonocardia hierapolitana]TWF79925.1 uncharacterized protein DUF4232 [Pseudonocardia hierapolitana]